MTRGTLPSIIDTAEFVVPSQFVSHLYFCITGPTYLNERSSLVD